MKHKVAGLDGSLLDAAVAKAEGLKSRPTTRGIEVFRLDDEHGDGSGWFPFHPQEWTDGGPIIEREHIDLEHAGNRGEEGFDPAGDWRAYAPTVDGLNMFVGPTPLIAAMRAFVATMDRPRSTAMPMTMCAGGEEVDLP